MNNVSYNTIKHYYVNNSSNPSSSSSSTSALLKIIIKQIIIIIDYYNNKDLENFNIEMTNFNNLLSQYPNYVNDLGSNTIVNLINIINVLYNNNIDLQTQKTNLEQELLEQHNKLYNISTTSYNLIQNTSIGLIYLQYMLLYDISDSNGVFLPSNLENAKQILINNNNVLVNMRN